VLSVAAALESDLEPFHKLRRFAPVSSASHPYLTCRRDLTPLLSHLLPRLVHLPVLNGHSCVSRPPTPIFKVQHLSPVSIILYQAILPTQEQVSDWVTGCELNVIGLGVFRCPNMALSIFTLSWAVDQLTQCSIHFSPPRCSSPKCAAHNFG
jgi:hypothetical protein